MMSDLEMNQPSSEGPVAMPPSRPIETTFKNGDEATDKEAELRVKHLPFNTTPAVVLAMKEKYGFKFTVSKEKRENFHPFLAYERNNLLHRIVASLTKTKLVCDVGGSPKRLRYFNKGQTRVIHLCPQLQPGDLQRFSGGEVHTTCHHTLEQHLANVNSRLEPHPLLPDRSCCINPIVGYTDCHVCKKVDTYVFCHSAYYIKPDVLAQAINSAKDKCIYVIGHVFKPDAGTHHIYNDQAQYTYTADGQVVFSAKGNSHSYVHDVLPWNDTPTFEVNGDVFEASLVRTLGETHLWMVTKTCYPSVAIQPIVADWKALILDKTHIGEIQTTLDPRLVNNLVNENYRINLNRFIGAGPFLIALADEARIRVPRGAIAAVSTAMVGRERNPVTFSHATAVARGYIERSQLPIEQRPTAIIAATVIGFSLHIQFETNMIDTARYRFSSWWSRHSNSLKLGSLTALPAFFVLFLMIVLDSTTVVVDQTTHIQHHPIFWVVVVVNGLLACIAGTVLCIQRKQSQNLASSFGELRINDGVGTAVLETLRVPLLKVPASRNFAPLSDIEEGCDLIVGQEPKPPIHDKPTLFAAGMIIPECMPVTAPSTQEAEKVAITNRVLAVNPFRMTDEFEEKYHEVFDSHPEFVKLKTIKIHDTIACVKAWLNRSRYSIQRREQLLAVAREVRNGRKVKTSSLAHVKSDEKLLKIKGVDNKAYSPRIVSASDDTHLAATGGFMWEWSNKVAQIWDGSDLVYYTRGATAEDVGGWFANYLYSMCDGKIDSVFFIEDDFEKYDSSIDREHQEPVRKSWVDAGAHWSTIGAFSTELTQGKTRNGLTYRTERQELDSGKSCTNVLGSEVNAAVHIAAIKPELSSALGDRMAVMGDDNLIGRSPTLLSSHMSVEEMTENLQLGGMRPGLMIRNHVAHVEFCSKIFLESPRHPGQWVLSPKPGRVMSKMGWNFVRSGETLYEDALSIKKDSMHVPFLRHYVKRTCELAPRKPRKHVGRIFEWDIRAKDYHDNKDGSLPQSTWDIVYERYGLTLTDEEEFGRYINGVTSLPCVLSHPVIAILVEKDCQ